MLVVMWMFVILVLMMCIVMRMLLVIGRSVVWEVGSVIADFRLCAVGVCRVNDIALNAFATTASARIAMPGTTAAGAVVRILLRFAMRALVGFDQRLPVGDGDLIVVGMNFAERQKSVAVAAVFDERRL